MKSFFTGFFLLLSMVFVSGQLTMHKLLNVGYNYQTNSFGEIGGKLLFLENDNLVYRVGASALLGSVNNQFAIIPKVQGDLLFNFEPQGKRDFDHSFYYIVGADFTTKYIAPKVGFNIFGILDITGGYGFSIDKSGINGKELKGANVNLSINLPIPFIYDEFH